MKILFTLYILFIVAGLICSKNKFLFWCMTLFMFGIYAFSTNSPDYYNTYVNRYENYQVISDITEPLFTLLIDLMHKLGLSVQAYYVILVALALAIPVYIIYMESSKPSMVMALYMMYSLPIELVQLRSSIAYGLVFLGMYICWKNDFKKWWIAALLILCGAMIHTSAFCYIFFIPVILFWNYKYRNLLFCGVFVIEEIALLVVKHSDVKNVVACIYNLGRWMNEAHSNISIAWFTCKALFVFVLVYFMLNKQKKWFVDIAIEGKNGLNQKELNKFASILNFATFLTIPVFIIDVDMYRVQRGVLYIFMIALCADIRELVPNIERKYRIRYWLTATFCFVVVYYTLFVMSGDYNSTMLAFYNL